LRDDHRVLFAGQITGVEGYTESTATGLVGAMVLTGLLGPNESLLRPPTLPPPTTMLGALYRYLREADPVHFQPMNANFGLLEELADPPRDKRVKRERYAERALADLATWSGPTAWLPVR
jgi:methylenetetrahydrofolate--tRNA-(uracil-5-)-methyltransferase